MATYHSDRPRIDVSPDPTEDESAAIAAALDVLLGLENDVEMTVTSRWVRTARHEAIGLDTDRDALRAWRRG